MSRLELDKAIKDCEDRIAMNIADRKRLMEVRFLEYGLEVSWSYAKFDSGTYSVPDWKEELTG